VQSVNLHEAQSQLARLVERAVAGEPFVITEAGKPLVLVSALPPTTHSKNPRLGFMAGQLRVPEDFDRMGGDEIVRLMGGEVSL
jgi:prevent-host-death family protein